MDTVPKNMVSREMPFKFSIAAPMTLVHNSVNFRSLRPRLQRFVFETMSLENIPLRKLDFFKKFTPEYSLLRESRTRRLKRLNLRSATFLSPRPSRERERERERETNGKKERKKRKLATGVDRWSSSLTYTKLDPVTPRARVLFELRSKGLSWTEWLIRIGGRSRAPLHTHTHTHTHTQVAVGRGPLHARRLSTLQLT